MLELQVVDEEGFAGKGLFVHDKIEGFLSGKGDSCYILLASGRTVELNLPLEEVPAALKRVGYSLAGVD